MGTRITGFTDGLAPEAAALFCSRYRDQRRLTPLLPTKYSKVETVAPLISGLIRKGQGVAAFDGSRLVGYLIGLRLPEFMGPRDGIYCPEWAHGATSSDREGIHEAMYRAAAEAWVSQGCPVHCITHLADDAEAKNAFAMMGFGITTVDAMMRSDLPARPMPPGVSVRSIDLGEVDDIVPLSEGLEEHLHASPTFMPRPMRRWREYYTGFLSKEDRSVWVAYKKGVALSYMKCEPGTEPGACQVVRDPRVLKISGAYTVPEARNRGFASAVLSTLQAASRRSYPKCSVDFESANPLATAFWLKHFTPVCYTMTRHVDERILRARA